MGKKESRKLSASFKAGAAALVFLIIGYQSALFISVVGKRKISRIEPEIKVIIDTVYVSQQSGKQIKRTSHYEEHQSLTAKAPMVEKRVESFPFNPNTVSVEDLTRLGFSLKQANSIDAYRQRGGKFNRPSDFARSFVVSDSIFERLSPFITIPKLDINRADSAEFDALPGIGPYFASKMVEYRNRLGGYSFTEQLMDIYRFDRDKFLSLEDLVEVGPSSAFRLWTLPEDSLKLHPYIGSYAAHGIVLYRENNSPDLWTVDALEQAGIINKDNASKLKRCRIQ